VHGGSRAWFAVGIVSLSAGAPLIAFGAVFIAIGPLAQLSQRYFDAGQFVRIDVVPFVLS
jgi:hypothetical protein